MAQNDRDTEIETEYLDNPLSQISVYIAPVEKQSQLPPSLKVDEMHGDPEETGQVSLSTTVNPKYGAISSFVPRLVGGIALSASAVGVVSWPWNRFWGKGKTQSCQGVELGRVISYQIRMER